MMGRVASLCFSNGIGWAGGWFGVTRSGWTVRIQTNVAHQQHVCTVLQPGINRTKVLKR